MFWLFTNKISSFFFFYQPRNLLKHIRMNQVSLMYKQHKLVNMLFRALHSCDPSDKMLFCTHTHTQTHKQNTLTLAQHTASHLNAKPLNGKVKAEIEGKTLPRIM